MSTTRPTTASPSAPTPPLLAARGVRKTYRTGEMSVPVLHGIDLDIDQGEFVAIIGPSGNGKTTLLNCLSSLDTIDGGNVYLRGESLHELPDRRRTDLRAREMGFVFQSFNLLPVLSAAENVEVPLLALGTKRRTARDAALAMLDRVGLIDRATHRPAELSGGEQQRVAVARALVAEPAVVWADEPTGNLDTENAAAIFALLLEVNAAGQTLVMVTHDRTIADAAPRLIEVRDGVIASDVRHNRHQLITPATPIRPTAAACS